MSENESWELDRRRMNRKGGKPRSCTPLLSAATRFGGKFSIFGKQKERKESKAQQQTTFKW